MSLFNSVRVRAASSGAFLLLLLAGCAQVNVDSGWAEDVDHDTSFDRVLVVGISPNASARCDFEYGMVSQLRVFTQAKPSCALMNTDEQLSRDAIEKVVAEYQADAVLATALVQGSSGAESGGQSDTRGDAMYKATGAGWGDFYYGGYGVYGVPVIYAEFETIPVVTTIEGEVTVDSMLYDTSDATLVYELTTSASDLDSRGDAIAAIAEPIAERLAAVGLIAN